MRTPLVETLLSLLQQVPSDIEIKDSLADLFDKSSYGCQKGYPVAVVHEKTRITDASSLTFFTDNNLIDSEGFTPSTYEDTQIKQIVSHAPSYIQRVNYIIGQNKTIPKPTFFNKFTHDYWKKIQSVEGLEALIDVTPFSNDITECKIEEALRAIIRKRKEVHQLKKLTFVWIAQTENHSTPVESVLKHYFNEDYAVIENKGKTYSIGWSVPLQSINMRYFVCPPI